MDVVKREATLPDAADVEPGPSGSGTETKATSAFLDGWGDGDNSPPELGKATGSKPGAVLFAADAPGTATDVVPVADKGSNEAAALSLVSASPHDAVPEKKNDGHGHGHGDGPETACGKFRALLQEYSLPLIGGVVVAMVMAQVWYEGYHDLWHTQWGEVKIFGHKLNAHFVINDIGMCFHFAIATKEIVEAALPGGTLNPPSKALNPIISTLGGVFGPVGVYFILAKIFFAADMFPCPEDIGCAKQCDDCGDGGHRRLAGTAYSSDTLFSASSCDTSLFLGCQGCNRTFEPAANVSHHEAVHSNHFSESVVMNGWGISTATDIVLAWMIGKRIFGNGHPAIPFLLLLAVADDAIGIIIIAIFYPDPHHPAAPQWLLLVALAVFLGIMMRRFKVGAWQLYILIPGTISWIGMIKSALHPALALVPIVPLLPSVTCPSWYGEWGTAKTGVKEEEEEVEVERDADFFIEAKKRLGFRTADVLQQHFGDEADTAEDAWQGGLTDLLRGSSLAADSPQRGGTGRRQSIALGHDAKDSFTANILSKIVFFRHFDRASLTELAGMMTEHTFATDEVVYHKGGNLDTFYVVLGGKIAIESGEEEHHSHVYVRTFKSGDFFGEFALFDIKDISDDPVIVVSESAKVLKLTKEDMKGMSKDLREHVDHMGNFFKEVMCDALDKIADHEDDIHDSPLFRFEHEVVFKVDIMLGCFAFANAGVKLDGAGAMTIVVAGALLGGKTLGIFMSGFLADLLMPKLAPLPQGISKQDLLCVAVTASIGLTVALFVSAEAFGDYPTLLRDANLGSMLSMFFCIPAMLLGRLMNVGTGVTSALGASAHDAAAAIEKEARQHVALLDATSEAELAADHAMAMDVVTSMSDEQVRRVFVKFMHDISMRIEHGFTGTELEQLQHKPEHTINAMLFQTLDGCKNRVAATENIEALFAKLDVDGSGSLDREEVRRLMIELKILGSDQNEVQLDELMAEMDEDDNDTVDLDEFKSWVERRFGASGSGAPRSRARTRNRTRAGANSKMDRFNSRDSVLGA